MRTIAIFVEQHNDKITSVGLELLSEVRRLLANQVRIVAIYLGSKIVNEDLAAIASCGSDETITLTLPMLKDYDTAIYADALYKIVSVNDFDVLLLGSTLQGRDLGPRLSARLNTGLTADATILDFEVETEHLSLLATRPALGGNLFATIICPHTKPQMATIRPGVFAIENFNGHQTKRITFDYIPNVESRVEILSRKPLETRHVDLTKAKLVIAGGRGVATQFETLKEIADLTGGEVACSRAVVDANLQPKERQVGQTGVTIRPSVYVAFGISGAIQHIAGMDKSEMIIAINTDPNALIFDIADISIIADANRVLPLLQAEIETIQKTH